MGNPVKSPLPKVILKVVFKDAADHAVLFEKIFKEKGVAAGTPLTLDFTAADLAPIRANRPMMSWPSLRALVHFFSSRGRGRRPIVQ